MSDLSDYTDLNIKDTLARIERQQAETRKFVAEQGKLQAEAAKLMRERWLMPFIAGATVTLAIGSIVTAYFGLRH